ncbi:MAG: sel1 repeat family protein, partial [Rubrivivax sp.]|nr:sel1 repeat family protein [Rubrivivax sp.]
MKQCGAYAAAGWLVVLSCVAVPARAATPAPAAVSPAASAADTLRQRAAAGDAQARHDLAVALLCGRVREREPGEALRWMALAAEQGHRGAQSVFGWMLMSGTGVARDDAQAARWLRAAAEGRDTAAQNNLGVLYATGQGVPRDRAEAE